MHALIFWGFLVLFPTILMAGIGAIDRDWSFPWLGRQGWYMAMVDVFILAVLVGHRRRRLDPQGRASRAASTARTSARPTSSSS